MILILIIAAATALGMAIGRALSLESGFEGWVFRMLAGLAACAALTLALGSISLAVAQTVLAAIALAGIVWAVWGRAHASQVEQDLRVRFPKTYAPQPISAFEWLCIALGTAAMAAALLEALAPVYRSEATTDLLALAADYARAGRIRLAEGNAHAAAPHLPYALFTLALFRGGELPVSLLNWLLGALACLAVYALGRRWAGRACGLCAAAFFATAPIEIGRASCRERV